MILYYVSADDIASHKFFVALPDVEKLSHLILVIRDIEYFNEFAICGPHDLGLRVLPAPPLIAEYLVEVEDWLRVLILLWAWSGGVLTSVTRSGHAFSGSRLAADQSLANWEL